MYTHDVSIVLLCMVLAGAGRSISVKVFYQLGFDSALVIALLYLLGGSLNLVIHGVWVLYQQHTRGVEPSLSRHSSHDYTNGEEADTNAEHVSLHTIEESEHEDEFIPPPSDAANGAENSSRHIMRTLSRRTSSRVISIDQQDFSGSERTLSGRSLPSGVPSGAVSVTLSENGDAEEDSFTIISRRSNIGSQTGITDAAHHAARWVHKIPGFVKPIIPGLLSLGNSTMRMGALMYIAASIAEMLNSGLELVLSVVAARFIRKRLISPTRWKGVGLVTVGLIVVGLVDIKGAESNSSSSTSDRVLGIALIFGQCTLSVLQDMAEELFLQEARFPPLLLVGMESAYGLILGIPLYFALALLFQEEPAETFDNFKNSSLLIGYAVGMTFLFMLTTMFDTLATCMTSSMTRNLWKNLRIIIVWAVSLIIYYSGGKNEDLGEPWRIPDSFFILIGFFVIMVGIYVYYKRGSEGSAAVLEG